MKIINQVNQSKTTKINFLTDGKLICYYQDFPEVFNSLQKTLKERGLTREDNFCLEVENSLKSAILLLYLLETGYSFLLLPKPQKNLSSTNNKQYIPRFCRYKLTTETLTKNGQEINLTDPDKFIKIEANSQWINQNSKISYTEPKLYLKTSGSTGKPKMVVHSHHKLEGNIRNCVNRLALNSNDRVAIPVPIYHMYGLGAAFLPSVAVGASIDLQKGANLLRYLQREQQFNPNVAFMTPIFCETLLKGRKSPRKYRLTVAAGDRFREETFSKYESRMGTLVKLYGSTEMGAMTAASPDESIEVRRQTVGQPMAEVQMRLEASPQLEKEEVMEEVGELWCYHKYGFDGYVDNYGEPIQQSPENQDGWFRTKDLGRILADGHIEVLGRCDHSVNRDGLLVFFSEVEQAIESISGIDSVVVVSKGESQRGKALTVYCIPAKGIEISATEIKKFCFDILPKRAIPDYINVVKSLPLMPNGKVDRQKLIHQDDQNSIN